MDYNERQDWFQQVRIDQSITRIWEPRVHRMFRGNIWLIEGRDIDLVIDFGLGLQSLRRVLQRDPAKPVLAVATHIHVDHVGCFHEFEERLGHRLEADYFSSMPDEFTLANLVRQMPEAAGEEPPSGWDSRTFALHNAPLTRSLEEGDMIDLGDFAFRVLHLPGHSPGSIGLFDESRKLLFSGDAIYEGRILDNMPGASVPDYITTMERLSSIDVDLVCGGHNHPISGDEMKAIAACYIADRD